MGRCRAFDEVRPPADRVDPVPEHLRQRGPDDLVRVVRPPAPETPAVVPSLYPSF